MLTPRGGGSPIVSGTNTTTRREAGMTRIRCCYGFNLLSRLFVFINISGCTLVFACLGRVTFRPTQGEGDSTLLLCSDHDLAWRSCTRRLSMPLRSWSRSFVFINISGCTSVSHVCRGGRQSPYSFEFVISRRGWYSAARRRIQNSRFEISDSGTAKDLLRTVQSFAAPAVVSGAHSLFSSTYPVVPRVSCGAQSAPPTEHSHHPYTLPWGGLALWNPALLSR